MCAGFAPPRSLRVRARIRCSRERTALTVMPSARGLLVAQLGPGHQQQQLPVPARQARQHRRQPRPQPVGGCPLRAAVADVTGQWLGRHGLEHPPVPGLRPPVRADLPDRDAIQPRSGVGAGGVVAVAAAERGQERLPGHVLGQVRAEPRMRIAQDLARVPVEDSPEAVWLAQRALDQLRIAHKPLHARLPGPWRRASPVHDHGPLHSSRRPACLRTAHPRQNVPHCYSAEDGHRVAGRGQKLPARSLHRGSGRRNRNQNRDIIPPGRPDQPCQPPARAGSSLYPSPGHDSRARNNLERGRHGVEPPGRRRQGQNLH